MTTDQRMRKTSEEKRRTFYSRGKLINAVLKTWQFFCLKTEHVTLLSQTDCTIYVQLHQAQFNFNRRLIQPRRHDNGGSQGYISQ